MPSAAADAPLTGRALAGLIGPAPVAAFADTLETLGCARGALALAVSGGTDSVALLLLAAAASRPDVVRVATVDHGLRAEAAAEAAWVAALCGRLGVPHATLDVAVSRGSGGPQAAAREARYEALETWARGSPLLTGHQQDDVAESLLMRLARGAGVRGLARMAEIGHRTTAGPALLRPLLGWSRGELAGVCARAGVTPLDDPSNDDPRFDRTRARRLLAAAPWLEPRNLARSAANLAEADAALEWLADRCWRERVAERGGALEIDAAGLPHDTRRRLAERALAALTDGRAPRDGLDAFVLRLAGGDHATLAGVMASPGPPWRLERAPPRRETAPVRS